MKKNRLLLYSSFLILALSFPHGLQAEGLTGYLNIFSSFSSRMPGSEGNILSAELIERKFREAGLTNIESETFESVVPVEEFAYIEADGRRMDIHCMWPNLVRTSTVPPGGLKGRLVYGEKGDLRSLEGKDLEGSIVLLDFDSGVSWQTIAMFGPSAFVFLEKGNINRTQAEQKVSSVPVNVPRFYAPEDTANMLLQLAEEGSEAALFARMDWKRVEDRNIMGYVEGTDAALREEIIVIQSFYDSVSVVPAISPGASSAVGISTMLDLVDYFSVRPPARTVLFLATSSYYQNRQGINDFVQRHMRKVPTFKDRIAEDDLIEPLLFVGLNLSDAADSLAVWHNTLNFPLQRRFAPLGRRFVTLAEGVSERLGYSPEYFVNGITPTRGLIWESFLPGDIKTEGEYVLLGGTPSVSLITVNDGRWRVDTPVDSFEKINLNNVRRQGEFLKHLLAGVLNNKDFFTDIDIRLDDLMADVTTTIVTFDPTQSFVPSTPVKDALVVPRISGQEKAFSFGVRNRMIRMTDEKGRARVTPVPIVEWGADVVLNAFKVDPSTGDIVLAPNLGESGARQFPIAVNVGRGTELDRIVVMFEAKAISLFALIDPQYLIQLDGVDVFDMANTFPDEYGFYLQHGDYIPFEWTSFVEPLGVIFAKPGTRIKIAGKSGPLGIRILMINAQAEPAEKEYAEGVGLAVDDISAVYNTPYAAARDMIVLNNFRRMNFEQYGIRNERLTGLQQESRQLLEGAEEALLNKDWYTFLKLSRQSQALESRAYPDVKATANDVVIGLIFYFLLLLPFAYFGERLFFGFPKLEKRILAFTGIFLVIYFIMRLVHPGFQLTEAPEVILLSFIILAMALLVIGLITSKFEEQMQQMKMEKSKVYKTDVGRVTAMGTAFSLGVANMKRRKVRTMLTSITLILLTFTVLSFTSISSYLRFNRISRPQSPVYRGLLLRDRGWSPLLEFAASYTESEFSGTAIVSPRSWLMLDRLGERSAMELSYGRESLLIEGILGLTPDEILPVRDTVVRGDWFENDYGNEIFLSLKTAEAFGLSGSETGQSVYVYGKQFNVRGFFDEDKLNKIKDLDDEAITPVDFSGIPQRELDQMKMEIEARVQTRPTIRVSPHMDASNVVIMPYRTVLDMSGSIQSVAVEFQEEEPIRSHIENFVSKLAVVIFAGFEDNTFIYSSIGLTAFAGLSNLIIPILIAAMIVLNTMLGSVYERLREIGTYSAVGLAPSHISALFLAESLVYAVLGAVGGYLIGQVVAGFLMATGLLKGLILNYSSLSAVFATIVIVITVLLSTIYPARKASQMAVPDVTRKWVLPKPKGDVWQFDFPFTVGEFEVLGLATFLYEYFHSYQDISIGNFNTNGAYFSYEKMKSKNNKYIIDTMVWIAPFDLGINQDLKMVFAPFGEYGFYAISMCMTRTSGESNDWQRLNRRFLDGIRKQFLIWRTIEDSVKEDYSENGKKLLKIN